LTRLYVESHGPLARSGGPFLREIEECRRNQRFFTLQRVDASENAPLVSPQRPRRTSRGGAEIKSQEKPE
jgi:hypothetical protein